MEVKEEDLAIAILRLIELEKCVCEGSGAAGVAAAISGQLDEFIGKRYIYVHFFTRNIIYLHYKLVIWT